MKNLLLLSLVVVLTLFVSAAKAEEAKKLVIFSQCNNAEPYRAAQNARFKELWANYDDVDFEIMDAQMDSSRQISQIETAIRKEPDLLIVAPLERGPLSNIVGKAKAAGIPVICLERDIENHDNFTTWVRSDNYVIGQQAGYYIVNYLTEKFGEPKGKVVDLRGTLGVEAEINRYNGAWDVINKYPEIKLVQESVVGWLQSKARERMTEILRAQPEIDVVYAHNDPMAVGAYLATKDLGREEEMIFVGVDGLNGPGGGIQKVKDGVINATFVYPLCADKAVEVGYEMLSDPNFTPEKQYAVDSQMVTQENATKLYKE